MTVVSIVIEVALTIYYRAMRCVEWRGHTERDQFVMRSVHKEIAHNKADT